MRNSVFARILCGALGAYLLNISVDSPDATPPHVREDLSINDQESMVEIVVEELLGYEDAISEFDDPDTEEHNKKNTTRIDLVTQQEVRHTYTGHQVQVGKHRFVERELQLVTGYEEIDSPPPKI